MKILNKAILATALLSCTFATESIAQYQVFPGKYAVKFTDKNDSPYSMDRPQEFLTQKSLDRRAKFDIKLDNTDIPVNPKYIDSLKAMGIGIQGVSKWLNCAVVICDSNKIEELKGVSFVDFDYNWRPKHEKKSEAEIFERPKVQKKEFDKSINLDYGKGENQAVMLNIQALHNLGYKGEGMTAAILDAGFYKVPKWKSFEKMISEGHILGTHDFADLDEDVYATDTHGMNVLSCIAGNVPGELVGTAPEASAYLFRTEISSSENVIEEFLWAFAAERADSLGVDLIHSSLGYHDFDDKSKSYEFSEMDGNTSPCTIAADFAASKGIFVTVSAGNEGDDPVWPWITTPADADSVLTVGAVDKNGNLVGFSSRGPSPDGRIKPDVCAKGLNAAVQGTSNHISQASGTSFSGPIMAGCCLCLMQAHPNAPVMTVMKAVKESGNKYNKPDGDYGYGIPDFELAHRILIKEGY